MARSISLMKIFCLLLCQSQQAGLSHFLDFSPMSTSRQKPPLRVPLHRLGAGKLMMTMERVPESSRTVLWQRT